MDCKLHEFNGEDDHVHLPVSYPPKLASSNLVEKLKGKSAYFLRKEYWNQIKNKLWGKHLWSPSYCAVSCGGAPLSMKSRCISITSIAVFVGFAIFFFIISSVEFFNRAGEGNLIRTSLAWIMA